MPTRKHLLVLALFALYALALFNRALVCDEALFWQDASIDGIPIRTAAAEAIRDGRLPLWDARVGNGFSVMGETQAGVFYPPHVLCYIGIPQYRANAILLAMHLTMAAFFMALFCRVWGLRWLPCVTAGLIFGFSGWFVTHSMVIAMVEAAAWLPLTLLCLEMWLRKPGERRWLIGAAASLAMPGLSSYPQMYFYTALAAALYMLVGVLWRSCGTAEGPNAKHPAQGRQAAWALSAAIALIFVLGLATLLAAAQFIPTLAIIGDSARSEMTAERLREMALNPRNLAFFVHPYIFGSYAEGNYFGRDHHYEVCGFVGTMALLFGIVGAVYGRGRGRVFAIALVPLALFMALANQNPLYDLFPHIPVFGYFRMAGRYVLLSSLGLALLAAYGLHAVGESRRATRLAFALSLLGVFICLAVPLGLRAARPQITQKLEGFVSAEAADASEARAKAAEKFDSFLERLGPKDANFALLFLCLAGTAIACGIQLRRTEGARWMPELALALTIIQLLIFAYHYNPTISTRYYESEPPLVRMLDRERGEAIFHDDEHATMGVIGGGRGWASGDMTDCWREWEIVRPNRQVIHNARSPAVAYPLVQRRNHDLLELLSRSLHGERHDEAGLTIANPVEVLSAIGARIIVTARGEILEDLPVAKRFGEALARRNLDVAPLAYFADGIVPCRSPNEALRRMCSPDFDFRRPVVEAGEGELLPLTLGRPDREIISHDDDHGHITIRCRCSSSGFLVVRDSYDHRFRCTIDGEPQRIFVTNYLFRSVPIPPGEHTVEMIYDARDQQLGIGVSLLALVLMLLGLVRGSRRPTGRNGSGA